MGKGRHASPFLLSPIISILVSANLGAGVKWVFVTSYPPEDLNAGEFDPEHLPKVFVDHYYSTFDAADRPSLANFYQESSMLAFEGHKIKGGKDIVAKLTGLPFRQSQHSVRTIDCQPSGPGGGVLVFVTGDLQIPGSRDLQFSQMFHLMPTPQGSFYVLNEVFRLING